MPVHRAGGLLFVAGFIVVLSLAAGAVVLLYWQDIRPLPPPPDHTRAPQWLKDLCWVSGRKWRPWREIVIHHTAGRNGSLASVDRYHRTDPGRLYESAGYHFIIGNGSESGDGEIEVCPRWKLQEDGAHCIGHNNVAIGICLVGNFETGPGPTDAQMLGLLRLVGYLADRYGVPVGSIYYHREIPGASTRCPGRHFPAERFKEVVKVVMDDYRPLPEPPAKETRDTEPR